MSLIAKKNSIIINDTNIIMHYPVHELGIASSLKNLKSEMYKLEIKNDMKTEINSEIKMNKKGENSININNINNDYLISNVVPDTLCDLNERDKSSFLGNHNNGEKKTITNSEINLNFLAERVPSTAIDASIINKNFAQKKWEKLRNVFKIISSIRNINARCLDNVSEIEVTLQKKKHNKIERQSSIAHIIGKGFSSQTSFEQSIELLAKQTKLFEYCASGLDSNLPKIIKLVRDDPLRNFFHESQKNKFFVNQKNYDGVTPLYIACLNGHLKVAENLITYGADHLIKCGEKSEEQSVLDVSIRWGHIKLVDYLTTLEWPIAYLKSGLKEASTRNNMELIKYMKKAITLHKLKNKSKYSCCF